MRGALERYSLPVQQRVPPGGGGGGGRLQGEGARVLTREDAVAARAERRRVERHQVGHLIVLGRLGGKLGPAAATKEKRDFYALCSRLDGKEIHERQIDDFRGATAQCGGGFTKLQVTSSKYINSSESSTQIYSGLQ